MQKSKKKVLQKFQPCHPNAHQLQPGSPCPVLVFQTPGREVRGRTRSTGRDQGQVTKEVLQDTDSISELPPSQERSQFEFQLCVVTCPLAVD